MIRLVLAIFFSFCTAPASTIRITSHDLTIISQKKKKNENIRVWHTPGNCSFTILYTLYTSDFYYNSWTCHLQKFSDHSSMIGGVTDNKEEAYRELIKNFVGWCVRIHLQLNIRKTKEEMVDFQSRRSPSPTPVSTNREVAEMVDTYRFLRVHLNNKLDWLTLRPSTGRDRAGCSF